MVRLSLRTRPTLRLLAAIALIAMPILTIWNLHLINKGRRPITFAQPLSGVTLTQKLEWSWQAFAEGTLQKAVSERVIEAIPVRRFLVRLNNELRFRFFAEPSIPELFVGAEGQLSAKTYLNEYCQRRSGLARDRAEAVIPALLQIQSHYQANNAIFLYLITPSKVAHLPHHFVGRWPCSGSEADRTGFVAEYADHLRAKGITVVDTASLVHGMRTTLNADLFPPGGIHWDELGATSATLAVVDEINRQARTSLVARPSFTYTKSSDITRTDRDLADLLNVLWPPIHYKTHRIQFQPERPCSSRPGQTASAAIVGSSFSTMLAEQLIEAGCLTNTRLFFYLMLETYGGSPFRILQSKPTNADLDGLRHAKIMILEENESFVAQSNYIEALRKLIAAR